jgi:hypothetical protein
VDRHRPVAGHHHRRDGVTTTGMYGGYRPYFGNVDIVTTP